MVACLACFKQPADCVRGGSSVWFVCVSCVGYIRYFSRRHVPELALSSNDVGNDASRRTLRVVS